MNLLVIGRDKTPILEHLPGTFLLIDDGPLIDALTIPKRRKVTHFDVAKHHFNPVKNLNPFTARKLARLIYAASPEAPHTLTVRNGRRELAKLLLNAKRLDKITGNRKDPAIAEALGMIDDILFSPLLKDILTKPKNFSTNGIVLVRLNRTELDEDDCFLLANLLIEQYKHTVIIPDFGFYGHKGHTALIRQNRLIAGVNYLSESELKNDLLLIDTKIGHHCLSEDAEILAEYAGKTRGTIAFTEFVQRSVGDG